MNKKIYHPLRFRIEVVYIIIIILLSAASIGQNFSPGISGSLVAVFFLFMGQRFNREEEIQFPWRMLIICASIILCIGLSIIVNLFYTIDIVYTHLFYIPIVLTGIWYPNYAISLALILGSIHTAISFLSRDVFFVAPILRSLVLLVVAVLTSRVTLKKEEILTERKKIDVEMEKARQLHETILPKDFPIIEDLSFAAYYRPSTQLGGDIYDVLPVQNKIILYLSDVSGHGLDSSFLGVFIKQTIKNYILFVPSQQIRPATLLQHLSKQFIQEKFPEEYFICIFLAVLDLETWELIYSGLGFQDTPLVKMGDGSNQRLFTKSLFISPCFPLYLLNFKENSITLTPGTTIFFHTDGLTEEKREGVYYRERLEKIFYKHAHQPPSIISQAIQEDFQSFNKGRPSGRDDITYLILQKKS